ncbi:MAG TPA: tetratricopeptide repeat protein, partial [Gemmatimonadaceae bacterium]|nr:tetratricopeptide repeat protein [Gemmatimonadaceae bacterium]
MSKIASLKKKAADLEKKSPDKAVAVYIELVAEMEKHPEDMDVALFNRLGDLLVKQHNVAEAANYYEKAVDFYTDGGFVNNAIALCNKILRVSPGRSTVYYKLGRISAQKGFKSDAKQNFLEYADRMQKAGRLDEAFRALAEFADLCPDQTDIRLMLADQLAKAGKKDEAIEQLQILHEQLDAEGESGEAAAAAERLRALDPNIEPRTSDNAAPTAKSSGKSSDLVFIDLGDSPAAQHARRSMAKRQTAGFKAISPKEEPPEPPKREPARPSAPARMSKAAPPPVAPAVPEPTPEPPAPPPPPPLEFVEPQPVIEARQTPDSPILMGFQTTSLTSADVNSDLSGGIGGLDIQPTSLYEEQTETTSEESSASRGEPEAANASIADFDFVMPGEAHTGEKVQMPDLDDTLIMPDAADTLSPENAAVSDLPPGPVSTAEVAAVSVEPLPVEARPSTLMAARSVEMLQAVVEGDPEDWASHRELAEAMLEAGERERGVRELELAMAGYERSGDLATAMSVADEIVRLEPGSVKHHQKRVEYAYRSNDRPQLVEAYLALADALFRGGHVDKSRTIYQRVLELSPDDARAQAALSTIPETPPEPPPTDLRSVGATKRASVAAPAPKAKPSPKLTPRSEEAFVNLGDWLREDNGPKDTRMVVAEEEPTGNEEADFADMLRKFKQGIAENVEDEDYQSHYDLGVAYKEMGLVDEAIAEFQKALRGPEKRVRTYEAIGQCFIEKGQNQMAATVLGRALSEKGHSDDQLVGVLYLLGRANEALGKGDDAMSYYQRVFVVDIQFHD